MTLVPGSGASHPTALGDATLYKAFTVDEFKCLAQIEWLVDGVLARGALAAIFGPTQAGKSALQLDMAISIAMQLPWAGRDTAKGKVIYLALEGQAGLRTRVEALAARLKEKLKDELTFVFDPFSLLSDADVQGIVQLARKMGDVALIIVDTLAFAMAGGDENSSRDMSTVVANAKLIQAATGATVMLVHHSGKNADRGMRGHSILAAAVDTAIEVKRRAAQRSWTAVKVRDAEDGIAGAFELETVESGVDHRGRPRRTVVVQHVELQGEPESHPARLGKHQQAALDAITRVLEEASAGVVAGQEEDDPPIGLGAARAHELVKEAIDVEPKRRGERASAAIKGLVSAGYLLEVDSVLYLREVPDL